MLLRSRILMSGRVALSEAGIEVREAEGRERVWRYVLGGKGAVRVVVVRPEGEGVVARVHFVG